VDKLLEEEMQLRESGAFSRNLGEYVSYWYVWSTYLDDIVLPLCHPLRLHVTIGP
jgi:hypothetical protein